MVDIITLGIIRQREPDYQGLRYHRTTPLVMLPVVCIVLLCTLTLLKHRIMYDASSSNTNRNTSLVSMLATSRCLRCTVREHHVVADIYSPPILPRFSQVDVDLDFHGESLCDYNFDAAHGLTGHELPSAIWPLQPSINHLHVYVRPF